MRICSRKRTKITNRKADQANKEKIHRPKIQEKGEVAYREKKTPMLGSLTYLNKCNKQQEMPLKEPGPRETAIAPSDSSAGRWARTASISAASFWHRLIRLGKSREAVSLGPSQRATLEVAPEVSIARRFMVDSPGLAPPKGPAQDPGRSRDGDPWWHAPG